MFESKKIAEMQKEINELKYEVTRLKNSGIMVDTMPSLKENSVYYPYPDRYKSIPLETVVRLIIDYLDISLFYKPSKPESTELVPKKEQGKAK